MNESRTVKLALHRKSGGFSLVEMAIVLAIVGLLLGGLLPTISSQIEQQRSNETRKQLDEIKGALTGFAVINGRLPCPANGATTSGDESTSGVPLTCTLNNGVLPWARLGVNETDAWGRRFTYRVSQGVTSNFADGVDGTGETACAVTIGVSFQLCSSANLYVKATSGGSDVAANVPAVVVSHGKNGCGAYLPNGIQVSIAAGNGSGDSCNNAGADQVENANDTIPFVSKDFSPSFDDIVIWLSPNTLINRMVTAGKLP